MIKVEVIVRIMCVRSFCGQRCWMLYEKWCCPLAICNRPLLLHCYIQLEFIQKIHLSSALFWVISRNFYFINGSATKHAIVCRKYYITMTHTIRILSNFWATDDTDRLQTDTDSTDRGLNGVQDRKRRLNSAIAVLWLRFFFGGIANLSFIFILIYVNKCCISHLVTCHPKKCNQNPVRPKCVLCPLKFNINIYINLCISSSSSGSDSYNVHALSDCTIKCYNHCVSFRLTNFRHCVL